MQQLPASLEAFDERRAELQLQLDTIGRLVDPEGTLARIEELEAEMNSNGFWGDQTKAAKVGAEHTRAKRKLDAFRGLQSEVEDIETLLEMGKEVGS